MSWRFVQGPTHSIDPVPLTTREWLFLPIRRLRAAFEVQELEHQKAIPHADIRALRETRWHNSLPFAARSPLIAEITEVEIQPTSDSGFCVLKLRTAIGNETTLWINGSAGIGVPLPVYSVSVDLNMTPHTKVLQDPGDPEYKKKV